MDERLKELMPYVLLKDCICVAVVMPPETMIGNAVDEHAISARSLGNGASIPSESTDVR